MVERCPYDKCSDTVELNPSLAIQLREEITACVYNMAAVDFEAFFAHFVARFLEQTEGVDDGQRQMLKANLKTDTVSELSLLSSMCSGIWHLFRSLG